MVLCGGDRAKMANLFGVILDFLFVGYGMSDQSFELNNRRSIQDAFMKKRFLC